MRNSSIELYRIIAMLFVVIVHCNSWLVGGMPEDFDETNISLFRVSQATIQAITCTCVNMFLLISGYFGLKLKWKSILNIYMLLISISIPFYLLSVYLGGTFSIRQFLSRFMAFSRSGYFVECYLLLMFFSPVLNAFVDKLGKKILLWVLLFWGIEIYFEFVLHDGDLGFKSGFSFIHFMLIYMIGRTLSLFQNQLIQISRRRFLTYYILSTFMILCLYIIFDMSSSYSYCSPFNIIATCSLFMIFAKSVYYNRWINWIASSTFAVFIIHMSNPVFNWLRNFDVKTLTSHTYSSYLLIMGGVIILVFIGSIIYDKVAKIVTVPIGNYLERNIQKINKKQFLFSKTQM